MEQKTNEAKNNSIRRGSMKKYWKLIIALAIICLTFISLNIEAKIPLKKAPNYQLKTVAGDDQLGENIVVDGYVMDGDMYSNPSFYSSIRIGQDADEKLLGKTFYKRMNGSFIPTDIERFRKDYKSFMRAKGIYKSYAESDSYLAFVDYKYTLGIYNYTELTLDVMNKQTKDRSTFDIQLKDMLDISDFTIDDISVVGNYAYVTGNYYQYYFDENDSDMQTENETFEYYLLTIDLEKKEMIDAELLTSIKYDDMYSFYSMITSLQDETGNEGAFIGVLKEGNDEVSNEYKQELTYGRYIDADENGHEVNLEVANDPPVALINQSLVFVYNKDGDTVIEYKDSLTGETTLSKTFAGISLDKEESFVSKEKVIYFIGNDSETGAGRRVFAFTTDTLELVYEGEIVTEQNEEGYELTIQHIGAKQ